MKKDKIIEYILLIILICILFFDLFVSKIFLNKYIFTVFLLLYLFICKKIIINRKVSNQNKKKVILIIVVLTAMYILILYIIGIFLGFYRNSTPFSFKNLYSRILPLVAIIFLSEWIRSIFIIKNNKKTTILMIIALVVIDVILNINLYKSFGLEEVLSLIGYVIFSSISTNLLGNYLSKRYGSIPIIVYKIITNIYIYVFPVLPDIFVFLQILFRMMVPYILYLVIDFTYSREVKMALNQKSTNVISLVITMILLLGLILLISCKFRYGIMVVGSGSMTGTINKGDAVVFEQYKKQELHIGDVIIFLYEKRPTIHRIIDIQTVNNEKNYYTKGDNNQDRDQDYRVEADIQGIVKFKVLYIGWPTLWVNELFN